MDVRQDFAKMDAAGRSRVIEAIKWMKTHQRSGVDGATATPDTKGGVYQRYVNFHSLGGVDADLSDFAILLSPEPKDTLQAVIIDGEKWDSSAKHPATDTGLKNFLDDMRRRFSGGNNATGGPFNNIDVVSPSLVPLLMGQINNSPFADIKLQMLKDGASASIELPFARTVKPGVRYRVETYEMAHRSPAFLPWHRVILRMFEKDLQFADKQLGKDKSGKIALPYWNFSRANDWDVKAKTSVWHKQNFGEVTDEAEGRITGDHFSKAGGWALFDAAGTKLTGLDGEVRRMRIADRGKSPSDALPLLDGFLPTAKAVTTLLADADYIGPNRGTGGSGLNRRFAGNVEHQIHDPMHGTVGGVATASGRTGSGQMSDMLFSPQDPIFWLFHCNIDRIWSRWQWAHDKRNDSKYPKFGMLPGRRRDDAMQPWAVSAPKPPYEFNVRIKDVLNAANFASTVNADNLLGKGYKYDSLAP